MTNDIRVAPCEHAEVSHDPFNGFVRVFLQDSVNHKLQHLHWLTEDCARQLGADLVAATGGDR